MLVKNGDKVTFIGCFISSPLIYKKTTVTTMQPVNELWNLCSVIIIFMGNIYLFLKIMRANRMKHSFSPTSIEIDLHKCCKHPLLCCRHVDVYGLECREQPETKTLKGEQRKETLVNSLYVISSKVLKLFVTDIAGLIKGVGWEGGFALRGDG